MSKTCASLPAMDTKTPNSQGKSESVDAARRRLLKAGAYAAPVVLGSLLASSAAARPGPPCSPASPPACSCVPSGLGTPNCP